MSEIQNQIEKLKTIQESMDVLTDSLVVNPVAKESTIIAESQSIKDKIDNIKLPEIDTTELAKQGENQEATNSAIYEKINILSSASTDDALGKVEIVNAIKFAGVDANMDMPLSVLAQKIREVAMQNVPLSSISGRVKFSDGVVVQSALDVVNRAASGNIVEYINESALTTLRADTSPYDTILKNVRYVRFGAATAGGVRTVYNLKQLEKLDIPLVRTLNDESFRYNSALKEVYAPSLKSFIGFPSFSINDSPKLIDFTLGTGSVSGTFNMNYNASTAYLSNSASLLSEQDILNGFTNNREKWLWNLRNHFAALLGETTDGQVVFHANAYAALDEETITAFTSKGWTVASA